MKKQHDVEKPVPAALATVNVGDGASLPLHGEREAPGLPRQLWPKPAPGKQKAAELEGYEGEGMADDEGTIGCQSVGRGRRHGA